MSASERASGRARRARAASDRLHDSLSPPFRPVPSRPVPSPPPVHPSSLTRRSLQAVLDGGPPALPPHTLCDFRLFSAYAEPAAPARVDVLGRLFEAPPPLPEPAPYVPPTQEELAASAAAGVSRYSVFSRPELRSQMGARNIAGGDTSSAQEMREKLAAADAKDAAAAAAAAAASEIANRGANDAARLAAALEGSQLVLITVPPLPPPVLSDAVTRLRSLSTRDLAALQVRERGRVRSRCREQTDERRSPTPAFSLSPFSRSPRLSSPLLAAPQYMRKPTPTLVVVFGALCVLLDLPT